MFGLPIRISLINMELMPKIISSCPKRQENKEENYLFKTKRNTNCNICRNFKNIHDAAHRMSKHHQTKLTEKFGIIKSKMKMIRSDSIAVHDEEWGLKEDLYCYFCDKPVQKNQVHQGFTIEYLGYMIHLAESDHIGAVKSYLKYHGRKDRFELYCKTKTDLENFLVKIPEAQRKYMAKLNLLNQKDVKQIKEIEVHRKHLVSEVLQSCSNIDSSVAGTSYQQQSKKSLSAQTFTHKQNKKLSDKPKVPPWLIKSNEGCDAQQTCDKPVIGPTMDTLMKHVANQKKKGLPVKRLGANVKQKPLNSSTWLPAFSGVWNKGRHRKMK